MLFLISSFLSRPATQHELSTCVDYRRAGALGARRGYLGRVWLNRHIEIRPMRLTSASRLERIETHASSTMDIYPLPPDKGGKALRRALL
jgi:hypothetical protein